MVGFIRFRGVLAEKASGGVFAIQVRGPVRVKADDKGGDPERTRAATLRKSLLDTGNKARDVSTRQHATTTANQFKIDFYRVR